jgi:acyl carrier protein phosphodiesterase
VIVDVFYDHYLARNWNEFHAELLPDFAARSYQLIQQHKEVLPPGVNRMLPYMIKGNWLVNYSTVEGIHRALTGMAHRTPYESKMDEASFDLKEYYEGFELEFKSFFPELKTFADNFLRKEKT